MPRLVVQMSSVIVWLVTLCVGLAGGVQDQAPGDGSPLCTDETINGTENPFFANHPVYSASERPLMDSRDYLRLLQGERLYIPWQTVDRDNNNTNEDSTSVSIAEIVLMYSNYHFILVDPNGNSHV